MNGIARRIQHPAHSLAAHPPLTPIQEALGMEAGTLTVCAFVCLAWLDREETEAEVLSVEIFSRLQAEQCLAAFLGSERSGCVGTVKASFDLADPEQRAALADVAVRMARVTPWLMQ